MPSLITTPEISSLPPEITNDPSARPVLTDDVSGLLHELLALLRQDVQQRPLPAVRIEVRGTTDPEEDTAQVLVRLWVSRLSRWEAHQYQQEFGVLVDGWAQSLSQDRQHLLAEKISFQVRRTAADA